jgi:hypothetical protein
MGGFFVFCTLAVGLFVRDEFQMKFWFVEFGSRVKANSSCIANIFDIFLESCGWAMCGFEAEAN